VAGQNDSLEYPEKTAIGTPVEKILLEEVIGCPMGIDEQWVMG